MVPRTAPAAMKYLVPNANSAEVEDGRQHYLVYSEQAQLVSATLFAGEQTEIQEGKPRMCKKGAPIG